MADPALTPQRALAYLGELSTDIRAAVVLSAGGERLAGGEELADSARALLEACDAPLVEVDTPRGSVVAGRSERYALAVVVGRLALPALVRYDVRRVLTDLETPPEAEASEPVMSAQREAEA
ncbi:MAG TPA: hypothetical protein VGI54_09260 [Solirubrobacteraceae bacterium]